MPDDFFSFDEALDELRLKEEELKRLVSEGEIRAFRKGDTMKLRKSDVESLRAELDRAGGGEVVDLGETGSDELVFEDDAVLQDDAGMATQEIADVDTLIEDEIEDVGELELDAGETDMGEDEDLAPVTAAPVRRQSALAATEEEHESMATRAFAILSAAVLFIAFPVCIGVSSSRADDLSKSIAGIFASFDEPAPGIAAPAEEEE